MKVSCEIIKDLLPLYHDDVCSEDSKKFVEQHVVKCEDCKSELVTFSMNIPLAIQSENMEESLLIQKISKKWRTDILKSSLKNTLIALLVIAIVALIIFTFFGIEIVTD